MIIGIEFSNWIILYILAVIVGFFIRIAIVSPLVSSAKDSEKRTIRQIIVLVILTILWGAASNGVATKNFMAGLLILTVFYMGYALSKKAGRDGYINSFLVFINGYFITAMSFMSFPANLILGIITVMLAVIVYRKLEPERKSVFWEIIILTVEAFIVSVLVWLKNWNDVISTMLVVVFVETAIYTLNIFIVYVIVLLCKENDDKYKNSIKGLDD